MTLFSEIKHDLAGAAILHEWLGNNGTPVSQSVAERRAKVCRNCPHNTHPRWWETAKNVIAERIRENIELKNRMALKVENEEDLHMCNRCGCCIHLLVHVPIIHVAHHTTQKQFDELPPHCWKKIEIQQAFKEN